MKCILDYWEDVVKMIKELACPGILFGVYLEYLKNLLDYNDNRSEKMKRKLAGHVCSCSDCRQRYKRAIEVMEQRAIRIISKKFNPEDITPELSKIFKRMADKTLLGILYF